MNDTFFQIDCDAPQNDQCFDGAISALPMGTGGLFGVASEPVHYARRAENIRRDPSEFCQVFLVLSGTVHITQRERQASLGAGQLCIYDTGTPFQLDMPASYRSLVFMLPRPMLSARLTGLEGFMGRAFGGHAGLSGVLGKMLQETSSIDPGVGQAALARLGAPLADMVALAVETELQGPPQISSRHSQLRARVKDRMLAEIDNPEIDINRIAHELGVGIRTLNRLFAAENTTAMQWLLQQRLAGSHRQLSEGRICRVADVALAHGFNNLSHFSRAFKTAFGVPPNSVLKKQRTAH